VDGFVLYDFRELGGDVNENVFAYSNRYGHERALIVYNNKYESVRGWLKRSTVMATTDGEKDEKRLIERNLAEGLAINTAATTFYIFQDYKSGLEYIRQGIKFADQGLYVELGAYQYHIFLEFREIQDDREGHYAQLESRLSGKGVPSMEEALKEMLLAPIHIPFREIANPLTLERLVNIRRDGLDAPQSRETMQLFKEGMTRFLSEATEYAKGGRGPEEIIQGQMRLLTAIVDLDRLCGSRQVGLSGTLRTALEKIERGMSDGEGLRNRFWRVSLAWLMICDLGRIQTEHDDGERSAALMDEWLLGPIILQVFQSLVGDDATAWQETDLVKILACHRWWFTTSREEVRGNLKALFLDPEVQRFLQFNWFEGVLWFSRERFEELLWWLFIVSLFDFVAKGSLGDRAFAPGIVERLDLTERLHQEAHGSDYRVEPILDGLERL
jgi:hypothetical protein